MGVSETTYERLLTEIQSGELPPGTVLGEVEQSGRLGVSRTPLRHAITRLVADGLVVQVSPRVTVVSDIAPADIRALFETRRALEETAARLAADRGDPRTFRELAAAFADVRLNTEAGRDAYYALIRRLDQATDDAVSNDYLIAALRTVRTHLVRVRLLARDNPARLLASVQEHHTIASAIAEGDGELAANATHVHLHNALASILVSVEEHTPEGVA